MQHLPKLKKHPAKKSMSHDASVSHIAFPIVADPPWTLLIRDLAAKKKARSNMKAVSVMAAAAPEKQVEQQAMLISRTWARRPKTAETAARPSATTCNTSAYVSHFTAISGISMGRVFPNSLFGSDHRAGVKTWAMQHIAPVSTHRIHSQHWVSSM